MNVDAYLQRIDIAHREPPGLPFLKLLHRQHLLHVPFENLDIHWGTEILLDLERIFEKIVRGKRGGFCYELNGLFHSLLEHLGFHCSLVSARMPKPDGSLSPEFEHMCILVHLEGQILLCDVGFGKGPTYPLKVQSEEMQMSLNNFYRVKHLGESGWWLEESSDGHIFEQKYLFSAKKRSLIEFIDRCYYQQNDPDSHFKKGKMITKATSTGRITMTEKMLKLTERGENKEYLLLNEDDFYIKLEEHFNIKRPTNRA